MLYDHTSEESFVESKINDLIKNSHIVPEDCYEITTNNYVEDEFYFKAFPNPVKSTINIVSSINLNIYTKFEVYDLNGRLIKNGKIFHSNIQTIKINLADLNCGIYILKIHSDKNKKEFKIVKS